MNNNKKKHLGIQPRVLSGNIAILKVNTLVFVFTDNNDN